MEGDGRRSPRRPGIQRIFRLSDGRWCTVSGFLVVILVGFCCSVTIGGVTEGYGHQTETTSSAANVPLSSSLVAGLDRTSAGLRKRRTARQVRSLQVEGGLVISQDTVWTSENNGLLVGSGGITIEPGVTLTVTEDVSVQVTGDFVVGGTLEILGSPDAQVELTLLGGGSLVFAETAEGAKYTDGGVDGEYDSGSILKNAILMLTSDVASGKSAIDCSNGKVPFWYNVRVSVASSGTLPFSQVAPVINIVGDADGHTSSSFSTAVVVHMRDVHVVTPTAGGSGSHRRLVFIDHVDFLSLQRIIMDDEISISLRKMRQVLVEDSSFAGDDDVLLESIGTLDFRDNVLTSAYLRVDSVGGSGTGAVRFEFNSLVDTLFVGESWDCENSLDCTIRNNTIVGAGLDISLSDSITIEFNTFRQITDDFGALKVTATSGSVFVEHNEFIECKGGDVIQLGPRRDSFYFRYNQVKKSVGKRVLWLFASTAYIGQNAFVVSHNFLDSDNQALEALVCLQGFFWQKIEYNVFQGLAPWVVKLALQEKNDKPVVMSHNYWDVVDDRFNTVYDGFIDVTEPIIDFQSVLVQPLAETSTNVRVVPLPTFQAEVGGMVPVPGATSPTTTIITSGVYNIVGSIIVPDGASLEVKDNVVLNFEEGRGIVVHFKGRLNMNGSNIILQGSNGPWHGLTLETSEPTVLKGRIQIRDAGISHTGPGALFLEDVSFITESFEIAPYDCVRSTQDTNNGWEPIADSVLTLRRVFMEGCGVFSSGRTFVRVTDSTVRRVGTRNAIHTKVVVRVDVEDCVIEDVRDGGYGVLLQMHHEKSVARVVGNTLSDVDNGLFLNLFYETAIVRKNTIRGRERVIPPSPSYTYAAFVRTVNDAVTLYFEENVVERWHDMNYVPVTLFFEAAGNVSTTEESVKVLQEENVKEGFFVGYNTFQDMSTATDSPIVDLAFRATNRDPTSLPHNTFDTSSLKVGTGTLMALFKISEWPAGCSDCNMRGTVFLDDVEGAESRLFLAANTVGGAPIIDFSESYWAGRTNDADISSVIWDGGDASMLSTVEFKDFLTAPPEDLGKADPDPAEQSMPIEALPDSVVTSFVVDRTVVVPHDTVEIQVQVKDEDDDAFTMNNVEVGVTLTVHDDASDVTRDKNLFKISSSAPDGLGGPSAHSTTVVLRHNGNLGDGDSGMTTAKFQLTPQDEAVKKGDYNVTVSVEWTMDGNLYKSSMSPQTITVTQGPRLHVRYFITKEVYSDDGLPYHGGAGAAAAAAAAALEPAIPFQLGMVVENRGFRSARDVNMTSSAPVLVDRSAVVNEIDESPPLQSNRPLDYDIVSLRVNDDTVATDRSAVAALKLGSIPSTWAATATYDLLSRSRGQFNDFVASWEYGVDLSGSGGGSFQHLTHVESVSSSDLVHTVRVHRQGGSGEEDDGRDDYLVNDSLDVRGNPDRVFTSNGMNFPVVAKTERYMWYTEIPDDEENVNDKTLIANNQFTPEEIDAAESDHESSHPWTYIQFEDPLGETDYVLQEVKRMDSEKTLKPRYNSWQTTKKEKDGRVWLASIHLFDLGMAQTYELKYRRVLPPSNIRVVRTKTDSISVVWSGDGTVSKSLKSGGYWVLVKPAELGKDYWRTAGFVTGGRDTFTVTNLGGGRSYVVWVRGGSTEEGIYERVGIKTPTITTYGTSTCGNGKVDGSFEECDDGPKGSIKCTVACMFTTEYLEDVVLPSDSNQETDPPSDLPPALAPPKSDPVALRNVKCTESEDDEFIAHVKSDEMENCRWLGQAKSRVKWYCDNIHRVRKLCPATCHLCSPDDKRNNNCHDRKDKRKKKTRFHIHVSAAKTCGWLSQKRSRQRVNCSLGMAGRQACPVTCESLDIVQCATSSAAFMGGALFGFPSWTSSTPLSSLSANVAPPRKGDNDYKHMDNRKRSNMD